MTVVTRQDRLHPFTVHFATTLDREPDSVGLPSARCMTGPPQYWQVIVNV
jgi:hypothetical protein